MTADDEPVVKPPRETMVVNLEVPDGIDLILTINGVRVELDEYTVVDS
jgi:hypothetical protein